MNKPLNEEKSKLLWTSILSEAENLPVLPDIVNKILQQIDDPKSDAAVFQDIISKDPVLTAKVLKMSNSAYYGFSREIDTISEAVIILGLETLKSIVIAASAFKSLNQPFDGYGLSKGELWRHSLATAMAARLIGKSLNYQDTEKFFISGLLHDIGKILLSKYLRKYVDDIKILVKMRGISFDEGEKQILGFNHCDVGAEIARYWKLPDLLVEVAKYHHSIQEATSKNELFVKVIHIADIIAYKTRLGMGVDGNFYFSNQAVFKELKVDSKLKKSITQQVYSSIREFERALL